MSDSDLFPTFILKQQNVVYWYAFYLQAKDDVQKDMDTALGDDKHESSVNSDSVRVSEDVPRSLSSLVQKSLPQSHTSTDSTSEIGKYS